MTYAMYTEKLAVYLRRIMTASSQEEALFFANEMEDFQKKNSHIPHAEILKRASVKRDARRCRQMRYKVYEDTDYDKPMRELRKKPFLTAADFVFLRDLKVKL